MGFGEDRESICQVVRVRRKVVGSLADLCRIWRSVAALLCAFRGSKEAWGAWSSSETLVGEIVALSRFCLSFAVFLLMYYNCCRSQ
jgi:hypothetical protein